MKGCEDALASIHRAHDDEADAGEVAALAAHTVDCPACAALQEELRLLSGMLREEHSRPLAAELVTAFDARLEAEARRETFWRQVEHTSRAWLRLAAGLAAAVGLAATLYTVTADPPPRVASTSASALDLLYTDVDITADVAAGLSVTDLNLEDLSDDR
jgi:anti-sigma factor RsiW